jgi:hypothetical protein
MPNYWKRSEPYRRRVKSPYQSTSAVLSFNHDGVEIARVRTKRRWLPVWHLMVFLYLILLIRLIALADIGPTGYASRMDEMRQGNFLERSAVWVMAMDPLSRRLAAELRGVLSVISR